MSLPPVPNTEIKSDNVWLGWFRRIQEILNRWIIVVGTSVVIGRFNQGTTFPALELTRSTDTNGFTTLEFSNAAGLRRLELVANGTTGAYGIPANASGINAPGTTGFHLSTNDLLRWSLSGVDGSIIGVGNYTITKTAAAAQSLLNVSSTGTGDSSAVVQTTNGTQSLFMVMHGTGHSGGFASQGWIYTNGIAPLILGTGSAERLRLKTTGQIRLQPLAADPGSLEDGDMWYNSTAGKFRGRAAGVTVDFH